MDHFDGTAVRQLALLDPEIRPAARAATRRPRLRLRLLRRDVYAELDRRRRRAQIAARRLVEGR